MRAIQEERGHAKKIAEYINQRGGRVSYTSIAAPASTPTTALQALHRALEMEKSIHAKLSALIEVASKHNDSHLEDWLVELLEEQYESIKKLGDLITKLNRAGPEGLGLYIFDKDLSS